MAASDQKHNAGAELLVDGSFESAAVGAKTWSHYAKVGGWKSDTEVEVWGKGFYGLKATDGDKIAELDYDRRGSNLYQDVETDAGVEYTFSFDYMKRPDSKAGSDTITVYWNGKEVGSVDPTTSEWSKATFAVVGTGGTDRIEFREEALDNDSYGGLIDNASLKVSTAWLESREKEAAAEKAAAEKAAAEKAAAERAAAEKAAAEKAAAEKAAAEKAAAEKAAAEKAAAEKAAAEKAAAEKAAAEKAAAEKAAAEKAAAEKAAAEKAAAEKAAAEKAAAEKAAADKAATEKAAAEKAAAEKAAAEKAVAEAGGVEDKHHDDTLIGTSKTDVLRGDGHENVVLGLGGNDRLVGGQGDDALYGGGSAKAGVADMNGLKISESFSGSVTFEGEGAGYKNAVGMYTYDADGNITGVKMLYANASAQGSGGALIAGESSVDVGFSGGDRVGFFVLPNGSGVSAENAKLLADANGRFELRSADGSPANVEAGGPLFLWHVDASGKATQLKSQYGSDLFHSIDKLNSDGISHVKGEIDPASGTVKFAFEDLKGGGDKDYDDVRFSVKIGEVNALLTPKVTAGSASTSTNDDLLLGGAGDDRLYGMSGADTLRGGLGDDKVYGNSGKDVLYGGVGDDFLSGGKDDDVIHDQGGNDVIKGDSGNDVVVAGAGNDSYSGGEGFDTLDFSAARRAMTIDLSKHTATGMGTDKFTGFEAVVGSSHSDVFKGSKSADVLFGGDGDDVIRGLGGADTFTGGDGADSYSWHAKDLLGSDGAHLGVDRITDFSKEDRLDLSQVLKGKKFGSLSDVVHVTDSDKGATVSVKLGDRFVDVVTLDGVSAGDLLESGMILS